MVDDGLTKVLLKAGIDKTLLAASAVSWAKAVWSESMCGPRAVRRSVAPLPVLGALSLRVHEHHGRRWREMPAASCQLDPTLISNPTGALLGRGLRLEGDAVLPEPIYDLVAFGQCPVVEN